MRLFLKKGGKATCPEDYKVEHNGEVFEWEIEQIQNRPEGTMVRAWILIPKKEEVGKDERHQGQSSKKANSAI